MECVQTRDNSRYIGSGTCPVKVANMKSKKDNPVLVSLVDTLLKEKKPIWKRTMQELTRSRRSRVEVNLSKIDRYAQEGSTILIPGTVLGSGSINKKGLTIAAFRFSGSAKKLIKEADCKIMSIDGLLKSNPEGKGVLLIK
jgi:large subunit ribosomal protein L18e